MEDQRPTWFVGAAFGGVDDQTSRFLRHGIWENGYTDRYIDDVKSIMSGDRIAIKAAYTRKRVEWPLTSLRQSFLNGALTRLIDPDGEGTYYECRDLGDRRCTVCG